MLKPSCDVGTSVSGMLIKNKVEKTFDNTCRGILWYEPNEKSFKTYFRNINPVVC